MCVCYAGARPAPAGWVWAWWTGVSGGRASAEVAGLFLEPPGGAHVLGDLRVLTGEAQPPVAAVRGDLGGSGRERERTATRWTGRNGGEGSYRL